MEDRKDDQNYKEKTKVKGYRQLFALGFCNGGTAT